MHKKLPVSAQYRVAGNLCKALAASKNTVDKALLICGYAAILKRISESNLIAVSSYAGVDFTDGTPSDILRYYVKAGFIEIIDEGKGVASIFDDDIIEEEDDELRYAKAQIEKYRRDLLNG
jgi:hypothetical protein